ncbi:RDD family protein [Thermococcus sp. M36]|uniref:RDD family protein n=1 Tax=Thermococcus sp. M36 TaxID=1638261 RepID=UPI00143B1D8C|nr:RDD family protein [Thermococcus sp. M36]
MEVEYQGVFRRTLAYIVDSIVLFSLFGTAHFLIFGTWVRHPPDMKGLLTTHPVCLLYLGLYLGYFTVLEGTMGFTIGKRVLGIMVQKENGEPCGMREALIRNLLRAVDGIASYLVGVLLIATSRKKQRFGDIVAKTVVVKGDWENKPNIWRSLMCHMKNWKS